MHVDGFHTRKKLERGEAWVAAWRTMQSSTERVDRSRAERALSDLYRERGLEVPEFVWVDGPRSALTAWHVVSRGRTPLRNPHTRGDIGNGRNRELYGLQDPFGLDPAWSFRALRRAQAHTPDQATGGFRADAGYAADGLRIRGHLADAVRESVPERPPAGAGAASMLGRTPRTEMLSRVVLGDRWNELAMLVGSDLAVDLAVRAAQQAAAELLDVRPSRDSASWALTLPAFDRTTVAIGALPEVLGIALWRQRAERAERTAAVKRRLELARTGAAFMAFEDLAIMVDRPTVVSFDEAGRLHGERGPALRYQDGTVVWADHGVRVPSEVITDPGSITIERIDAQGNAEVRRVMTERFGPERLVREGGAELVDEDEVGRLWRRRFPGPVWHRSEPVVMVEVRNATPEPDGSVRTYFLRVPPTVRTAREGVAWTFGLQGETYQPAVET